MAVCNESKPYIFISYSHRDSDKVLKIMDRLKSADYNVWYDGGIDPGTEWDENIAKHVQGCAYFIAFVSANYIASKNCKDELNYSRDLDKEQLLVYLEDVELPGGMAMRMNRIQAIWWNKYSNVEEAYEKLFSAKGIDRAKLGWEGAQPVSTGGEASGSASKSESETFKEKTSAGNKDKKPFIIGGIAAAVLAVVALIAVLVSGGGKKYMEQGIAAYNSKYHGTEDNAAARAAFEKAVQKGEADAYYYLGRIDELEYKYTDARDHYNKGIEAGSNLSKVGLAGLYLNGYGGAYDRENARKLTEEAYGAGCKEAAYYMGRIIRVGLAGATRNEDKALEYYKEAAETDDQYIAASACASLGNFYKNGTGNIEQNYNEALVWYKKEAEACPYYDGSAYDYIAKVYKAQDEGLKADESFKKAYDAYLAAAEQGNLDSINMIGVYLRDGNGVEPDYPAAIEWYKKAAEGGNYAAMRNLALNYLNNENNPKKAEEYYQMAVDAGDITSMDKMGDLYYDGKLNDGNPDYKLARQWYEKAADLGYSDAMYSLGKMYYDGKETGTADYKTARQWYEKAVDAGSSSAMNSMGYGYERGGFSEDGQPDYAKAVEWYELAAENGNSTAMNNLGILYSSEGNGITDYAKAEEWYLKGAAEGNNSSMNNLGNMYSNEKYGMVDIEKA
ncbi:MAG: toll/interleukin-1 receptor domain-containing protein, partial [Lachnospiraceae bacterium]|nr:toll/interleukin-1 receptor domain-containing protein [Lachnospiraceae bacterium]